MLVEFQKSKFTDYSSKINEARLACVASKLQQA